MIVVADTSVLLNLAFLGKGDLLGQLFGEVWLPHAVVREFQRMSASKGRFAGLALPRCCKECTVTRLPVEITSDAKLDPGEAEALGLAIEHQADAVLLDEVFARGAAARLGFTAIGTAGLLVMAKQRGFISELAPLLRKVIVEGGFRFSEALLREVLRRAGELP